SPEPEQPRRDQTCREQDRSPDELAIHDRSHARPRARGACAGRYASSRNGYRKSVGGTNVSLSVRAATNRRRFSGEPALSSVPDARAPPNGCWPTTAPVGLSLM